MMHCKKRKPPDGRNADVVATWHDVSSPPPSVRYSSPTSAAMDAKGVTYLGTHYGGPTPWMNDVIHTVTPDYPYTARAAREQGTGLYRLILDLKTGAVTRVTTIRSTGYGKLDDSVIAAVRQWRWKPGKWKGNWVACHLHNFVVLGVDVLVCNCFGLAMVLRRPSLR